MASIDGLGSGLDTSTIIRQLMQIERQPQARLSAKRTAVLSAGAEWGRISSSLTALQTSLTKLGAPGALSTAAATVSNSAALGVTTGLGAAAGTHTVKVTALATAAQLTSVGSFSSGSAVVGAGALLVQRDGAPEALGAKGVDVTGTATLGREYSVTVTRASAAASVTGAARTISAGSPVTVKGPDNSSDGNDQLVLQIGDQKVTATIASGTYTSGTALATAVQNAINASPDSPGITVSYTAAGAFEFRTTSEGSSVHLAVDESPARGGFGTLGLQTRATTANGLLGLTRGDSGTGQDGEVAVDGTTQTVTRLDGSDLVAGSVVLKGVRHLATGSLAVTALGRTTTTGATLEQLVTSINAAGGAYRAAAVDDGTGGVRLVVSDSRTGAGNPVSVATTLSGFGSGFTQKSGTNAQVEVDGTTYTPSSNKAAGLIPGVTLDLKAVSTDPVTVTLTRDDAGIRATASAFVDAVNATLRQVKSATAYDPAAKKGGALVGDSAARGLASRLVSAVSDASAAATGGVSLGSLGITLQRDGTYAFDPAKFDAASSQPGAAALVTDMTTRLTAVVKDATGTGGAATLGKSASEAEAKRLQQQVDRWDDRLELVESRLRRQFTALDSALGSLRNQGTWLSGQIKSLPSWGR